MQFLSRPPMSRKIRPPKVIQYAVFKIATIPVLVETVIEDTPVPEEPYVDISPFVMMESLFVAVAQRSVEQMGVSNTLNMPVYRNDRVLAENAAIETEEFRSEEVAKIRMDTLIQYNPPNEPYQFSDRHFFGIKPCSETPFLQILNEMAMLPNAYEEIPRPISMIQSYYVDIQKIQDYFDCLKADPSTRDYIYNRIQPIIPHTGSCVGPMLKTVEYVSRESDPTLPEIHMMKYVDGDDVGRFHMVNMLRDSAISADTASSRDMIYEIQPIDTRKINQLFCHIQSDYSYTETREVVMELRSSTYPGILSLLEKINEYEAKEEDNKNIDVFALNYSLKLMDMIELLDVYEWLNDATPEATLSFGKPTASISHITDTLKESIPPIIEEVVYPTVDMIERMNIMNLISPNAFKLPFADDTIVEPPKPRVAKTSIDFSFMKKPDERPVSIPYANLSEPKPDDLLQFSMNTRTVLSPEPIKREYSTSPKVNAIDTKTYVSVSLPVKKSQEPEKASYLPKDRIILSLTTTAVRIHKFLQIIGSLEHTPGVYMVIINVCRQYRRMGKWIEEDELESIQNNPVILGLNAAYAYTKYMVRVTEDFGPITKLTGAVEYMLNERLIHHRLIIIDDDTIYENQCLANLESHKTPNMIVSGSGFMFYDNLDYTIASSQFRSVPVDIVEGFAGICFDYSDINKQMLRFVRYYRTIDWDKKNEDEVNLFLRACLLGDDFIISYFYHNAFYELRKINGILHYIKQHDFGFLSDALHRNTTFKTNMGTYVYIYQHLHMLNTFLCKLEVCRHIVYKINKRI